MSAPSANIFSRLAGSLNIVMWVYKYISNLSCNIVGELLDWGWLPAYTLHVNFQGYPNKLHNWNFATAYEKQFN